MPAAGGCPVTDPYSHTGGFLWKMICDSGGHKDEAQCLQMRSKSFLAGFGMNFARDGIAC